ncbi:MAG: response regulator [Melioribacteraceae bacterium]|nr:response regulator [Melioribacteraceae bacterium]
MKKALVAEDQLYNQVLLERILKNEFNMQVIKAENGLEALTKYDRDKPDLIFLDVSMPEMNGMEFIKELRENKNDKDTPVIVLTANSNRELVSYFIEKGISGYLLKPMKYDQMKERISDILEKKIAM